MPLQLFPSRLRRFGAALVVTLCAAAAVIPLGSANAAGAPAPRAIAYSAPVAPKGAPQVNLHVEEQGAGPPLLLLHGLGASTYSWRHVMPALARTHRVIALDLRGFGRSDKPFDQRYSAADQATHVLAFIARRGLKRVTLVGHSFGGAVALLTTLELNARAPGTVGDWCCSTCRPFRSHRPRSWNSCAGLCCRMRCCRWCRRNWRPPQR